MQVYPGYARMVRSSLKLSNQAAPLVMSVNSALTAVSCRTAHSITTVTVTKLSRLDDSVQTVSMALMEKQATRLLQTAHLVTRLSSVPQAVSLETVLLAISVSQRPIVTHQMLLHSMIKLTHARLASTVMKVLRNRRNALPQPSLSSLLPSKRLSAQSAKLVTIVRSKVRSQLTVL